jgi:hypothetical protein
MRESLLKSFDEVWIDCLNGDKYKTGKVIPKGVPGEGATDQSIFTTEHDPRGIQVGTGIATLLRRGRSTPKTGAAVVHHRNYWGRSKEKREALVASLSMDGWTPAQKASTSKLPEGPRSFEQFEPTQQARWKLVPFSAQGGFDDWPAIDQVFLAKVQGVNPNRGLQGTVIETDREILEERMREYFSDLPHSRLKEVHPLLFEARAGYQADRVRDELRASGRFSPERLVPYVVFPLDLRWLYYETRSKLLNRPRPDLYENLDANEFLVTVTASIW